MYLDSVFTAQTPRALPPQRRLRIGLLGLGTVGRGVWQVLQRNQDDIIARSGVEFAITRIAVRDGGKARAGLDAAACQALTQDVLGVATDPAIDIVVEAMGGTDLAHAAVLQAIAAGKPVVTANKALLALHGQEIFRAAERHGVSVAYEAAVAVSIPIIKALREGLSANRVQAVAGIINGTSNFILSGMRQQGLDFADVLADAQARGYAEADPSFDVDGVDAAHKLTLLAGNAFGTAVRLDQLSVEGIAQVQTEDLLLAERLGYRVKLLGQAFLTDGGLAAGVHPCLVPAQHLLAQVESAMNAVLVHSDAAGPTLFYGAGAGAEQTASAVIADLVDLGRQWRYAPALAVPHLGYHSAAVQGWPVQALAERPHRHYLRLSGPQGHPALSALAAQGVQLEKQLEEVHEKAPHEAQAEPGRREVWLTSPLRSADLQAALRQAAGWEGSWACLRLAELEPPGRVA